MTFIDMVRDFHAAGEMTDAMRPSICSWTVTNLRHRLMSEELEEYRRAVPWSLVEVLDALCDMQYVLLGTVLQHGLSEVFDAAFAEVHRSNMAKFSDGVLRRDDGKIMKPMGWQPPNLGQFLPGWPA